MKEDGVIKELISKGILDSTTRNRLQILDAIDMSMYGGTSWPLTIQTIGKKTGKDGVFDLGLAMGTDAAEELAAAIKKKKLFLPESVLLVDNLIQAAGFGVVEIDVIKRKKEIVLYVNNNAMLKLAYQMYGEKSLTDWFYAGVYTGMIRVLLGVPKCKLRVQKKKKKGTVEYVYTYKG